MLKLTKTTTVHAVNTRAVQQIRYKTAPFC